jgi:hypothetical protein
MNPIACRIGLVTVAVTAALAAGARPSLALPSGARPPVGPAPAAPPAVDQTHRPDPNSSPRNWEWHFALAAYDVPREVIGSGFAGPKVAAFLDLERAVWRWLRVGAEVGVALPLGPLAGASARAALIDRPDLTLSFGAGPLVDLSSRAGGPAYLANFDISAAIRRTSGVVLLFRVSDGIAVASPGPRRCGIDTCAAYVGAGDSLLTARIGVGYAF